jgi:hypothetical protein
MLRRNLILTTALLPVACSTAPTPTPEPKPNPWQSVSFDVTLLVSGLKVLLPFIVTPATSDRYSGYIDDIAKIAQALLAAQDANSAKSLVQQAIADVQAVIGNLPANVKLPSSVQTALAAISALMPVIEAAVGLFGAPRRSSMSPEQARAVLRSMR